MTISFAQLHEIMSPLEEMCKQEKKVSLSGVEVTLRPLTPLEETEVQKLLPDVTGSPSVAMEFADVYRRETLCRAIVEVNGMDLRSTTHVETGETLPSGLPIKITKEEAVNRLIEKWSRPVLSKLFEQYTKLNEEIEENMDESLKLNTEDTKAKVDNLETRAEELKRPEVLDDLSQNKTASDVEDVQ